MVHEGTKVAVRSLTSVNPTGNFEGWVVCMKDSDMFHILLYQTSSAMQLSTVDMSNLVQCESFTSIQPA